MNEKETAPRMLSDQEIGEMKRKTLSRKRIYWAIWIVNMLLIACIVFEIFDLFF